MARSTSRIRSADSDVSNQFERVVRIDDMTGKNWIRYGKGGGGVGEFSQATGLWVH